MKTLNGQTSKYVLELFTIISEVLSISVRLVENGMLRIDRKQDFMKIHLTFLVQNSGTNYLSK